MGKKRVRYWRTPDTRKHRKRVAPPTTGWLRAELAEMLNIAPGTIGRYIKLGMLPSVEFRGTATRYQRVHLLRLLAIRHLRSEGFAERRQVKETMDSWTSERLERWVLSHRHSESITAALQASAPNPIAPSPGAAATPAGGAAAPKSVHDEHPAAVARDMSQVNGPPDATALAAGALQLANAMLHAETWQQVPVGAGVLIAWRTDADPAAKELVKRLIAAV